MQVLCNYLETCLVLDTLWWLKWSSLFVVDTVLTVCICCRMEWEVKWSSIKHLCIYTRPIIITILFGVKSYFCLASWLLQEKMSSSMNSWPAALPLLACFLFHGCGHKLLIQQYKHENPIWNKYFLFAGSAISRRGFQSSSWSSFEAVSFALSSKKKMQIFLTLDFSSEL